MRAMASSENSSTDVLLREFTHRVKNEFASAIQVVSFAAEKSRDRNVKAALEGVMEKLHDYASVHRALQMPSGNDCIDASAYLRDLCGSISRSKLENKNIELVLVDRPFRMSSERCWLLGMIIAELITNAARHAFDSSGGTIRVECRPSGELVECFVSDNGSASTPSFSSISARPAARPSSSSRSSTTSASSPPPSAAGKPTPRMRRDPVHLSPCGRGRIAFARGISYPPLEGEGRLT